MKRNQYFFPVLLWDKQNNTLIVKHVMILHDMDIKQSFLFANGTNLSASYKVSPPL